MLIAALTLMYPLEIILLDSLRLSYPTHLAILTVPSLPLLFANN